MPDSSSADAFASGQAGEVDFSAGSVHIESIVIKGRVGRWVVADPAPSTDDDAEHEPATWEVATSLIVGLCLVAMILLSAIALGMDAVLHSHSIAVANRRDWEMAVQYLYRVVPALVLTLVAAVIVSSRLTKDTQEDQEIPDAPSQDDTPALNPALESVPIRYPYPRGSFLMGVARIFDFPNKLSTSSRIRGLPAPDDAALYSDWCAVGNDMRAVLSKPGLTDELIKENVRETSTANREA